MIPLPKNVIPIPFANKNEITAYEKILLNGRNIVGNITEPYKQGEIVVISHDLEGDMTEVINRVNASLDRIKKMVALTAINDEQIESVTYFTQLSGGTTYIRNIQVNPFATMKFNIITTHFVYTHKDLDKDDIMTLSGADEFTIYF